MQISSKKIKLSLISHNEISEIFFSPEQTFSDLKKQIKNIKLYTVTETVDTRKYKIDDLRKWLNADEFIEYITCVRLDMNEFIN